MYGCVFFPKHIHFPSYVGTSPLPDPCLLFSLGAFSFQPGLSGWLPWLQILPRICHLDCTQAYLKAQNIASFEAPRQAKRLTAVDGG